MAVPKGFFKMCLVLRCGAALYTPRGGGRNTYSGDHHKKGEGLCKNKPEPVYKSI